ncbi:MAG: serine hydrolase [Methanothrix sp.]
MNSVRILALAAGTILCMVFMAACTAPGPSGAQISPAVTQPAGSATSPVCGAWSLGNADLRQIIGKFDVYAEKARQEWGVPGMAIAIVKGNDVLLSKGYGVKTAGSSDPVTTETVFQIASTSKALTSAMVAMEVDRGALKWDDRVIKYLPDFQMNDSWVTRELTITDTMAHRSGLPEYWGDDLMVLGYNDSYAIHALRYAEPVTSFRSQYAYQNVVYSIPTVIVEKTTGKSWQENLKSRIFTPLKMTGSSADYELFSSAKDVASPHMYRVTGNESLISETIPMNSPLRNMTYLQPGAGGINSNIHDMANWLMFQMGNGTFEGQRLISEENLNYVHSPKTPMKANMQDKMYYCQGWVYQESAYGPIIWHSGAVGGFHNYIGYSPKEKVGIVILTNNLQSNLADALFEQFFAMYFTSTTVDISGESLKAYRAQMAVASQPAPTPPVSPASSLPLSAYTGTYSNTTYGTAVVSGHNGNLTITVGQNEMKLPLSHWDGNTFLALSDFIKGLVMFEAGQDNKAKSVAVPLGRATLVFSRVPT